MASNTFGYNTHSIVGSVDTINTDITFYSPDELSKILQLKKVTKDTIVTATNKYINKFRQENNRRLMNFFAEVQRKLILSLEPENKRSIVNKKDSKSEQYDTDEQLNDWAQNQNQIQESEDAVLYPLGTTNRTQKVDIYDDHHNVMKQEKLAVQHNPDIVQGQINPNLKNTITRIVNIDSKYRLSAVPNVKNKNFRDIVNHHTSAWSGTDYTLDFNDPLRKVLSLKLYSLQIPYSWYTIDTAYGTSCFVLKQLTASPQHIINGVSGVATLENIITRFVTVDGYNIVNTDISGQVVNFNGEVISGLTNETNMSFFFITDTGDIINPNGVRVTTKAGKYMKVLVNSKNYVKTNNPPYVSDKSLNRILDVNGFPTRFLKRNFSEPSSTGTLLTTVNGTQRSNLYFTIDKYGNTVTHINIVDGDKVYEHSPKIIFDNKKAFLNIDSTGDVYTINSNGTIKYDSSNTGIDLNEKIIFNSNNSFKNSDTIHDVIVDSGNYTPIELVTEINNKLKENIESTQIITNEIGYYNDSISSITVQLTDRKIVVGGTYFDGTNNQMVICRYNTNGTLDTTFNNTGKLTISIDINDDEMSSIVYTHHDGKLIFGGTSINDVTKTKDFIVGRVNTNGTLDTTFGTDKTGSVRHSFGIGDDVLTTVVCQNHDNTTDANPSPTDIFAGGYSYNTTTNKYDFIVVKMNSAGYIDTTFGKKRYTTELLTVDDDILTCMALSGATDNKLVLGGYSATAVPLRHATSYKYECILVSINTTSGVLDTGFNIGGVFKFSFNSDTADSILRCITATTKYTGTFNTTPFTCANTTNSISDGTYVTISYSATGSGTGATISQVAINAASKITSFTISSGGSGYVAGNTLTITVDGNEFTPYTIENDDLINGVLIARTIHFYTISSTVNPSSTTTVEISSAIISNSGKLSSFTVSAGGAGYSVDDALTITINGTTTYGAYTILTSDLTGLHPYRNVLNTGTITPGTALDGTGTVLSDGKYSSITLLTTIISYSTTGNGTGATITEVTINDTSEITSFTISSGGSGYVAGNTLTITVDGIVFTPYTILSGDLTGTALTVRTINLYTISSTVTPTSTTAVEISSAIISNSGKLSSFVVYEGGTGYAANDTLIITIRGHNTTDTYGAYTILTSNLTSDIVNTGTITPGTALDGTGTALTDGTYNGTLTTSGTSLRRGTYTHQSTGTYIHAAFTHTTSGTGTNASIKKIVIAGEVSTITMNSAGINYKEDDTITIKINNVSLDTYTIDGNVTASSDNYLVGGYVFNTTSDTYDFALACISSSGELNTTFNSTGIKIIAINPHHNFLTAISVDINNNIIASGYTYNGTTYDFTTVRMSLAGVMDSTFGTGGIVTTTIDNTDLVISDIIPNLDGKITVVGSATKNSNSDFALTRYTINGNIDSTFVNKNNEKTYATMTYNTKNGKSSIVTYNKFYSVLFYKQNEPFCTPKCGQGPRANNNLGWICGFRDQEYTSLDATTNTINTFSFTGESIVDTFGPRYFLLSIDDYNSNQINKAIVSIENVEKKADIPSYYSSDLTPNPACDTTNALYSVPQYLQGRPAQITQAQQYTLNEIIKNRKETSNNVLTSPTNSNVFAVIPLKKSGMVAGDALIEFSGPIQINERNYFGPVDIDKMRVQLLDDKGNIVNLNGMDWSFSIVTEHLYQY